MALAQEETMIDKREIADWIQEQLGKIPEERPPRHVDRFWTPYCPSSELTVDDRLRYLTITLQVVEVAYQVDSFTVCGLVFELVRSTHFEALVPSTPSEVVATELYPPEVVILDPSNRAQMFGWMSADRSKTIDPQRVLGVDRPDALAEYFEIKDPEDGEEAPIRRFITVRFEKQ